MKLEGALDLRGFFAVKDGVRAGFNDVRHGAAEKQRARGSFITMGQSTRGERRPDKLR